MITIDKNIAMPNGKFPFHLMEIGDSFLASAEYKGTVNSLASAIGKAKGKKFTCRTQPDGTVRCWRIK